MNKYIRKYGSKKPTVFPDYKDEKPAHYCFWFYPSNDHLHITSMTRFLISAFLLLVTVFVTVSSRFEYPSAEIGNGKVTAKLYLPDGPSGYYQGTRFDHAGVVYSLEYNGHQFFGQWNAQNTPKLHDAIMGPVEEFVALGYTEAPAGGEFVKIGVGKLAKPDDKPYNFARVYDVKDPGKWSINKKSDRIEFTHILNDAAGYSYEYKKTLRLERGKPVLTLTHSLKNTGSKTIETSTYNHNFFMIDQEPTGPNMTTTFPFPVAAEGKGFGTIAEIKNQSIIYNRTLQNGENVFSSGLQGLTNSSNDYNIKIENIKTGAGVHITGDQPIEKLVYWSCATTSCPEPYVKLSLKPGESKKWNIAYEFYTKQ